MALSVGQTFKLGKGIRTGVAPGGSQFGVGAGQSVKIIGSRNVGGQQFFDIKHIGGGTGWTTGAGLQAAFSGSGGAGKKIGPSAESIVAKAAEQKILKQQAGLKKEGAAIQSEFEQFVSGQEAVPDLRRRLGEELGIPELSAQLEPLRQQALKLGGDLFRLPGDVEARTRGSLITESQTRLLEQRAGKELGAQLRDISLAQELFAGQLTGAQTELVAELSAFGQQYARELLPLQVKITSFSERAARESSSFSTAVQNTLNASLQGIQRLSDIAENELQRIHDMALQEQQFVNDLKKISAQGAISATAQGKQTAKEAEKNNILSQISKSLAGGQSAQGTAGLQAMSRKALAQYPQFQKEIDALVDSFRFIVK